MREETGVDIDSEVTLLGVDLASARERDAELLWLHIDADLAPYGFEQFPGYVRMRGGQTD